MLTGLVACTAAEPGAGTPGGTGATAGSSAGGTSALIPAPTSQSIGQGLVRHLTRTEYNNTVRALLGTSLTPADGFPGDIGADGFDKASGPQTIVANHLTAFEGAAADLVEAAFADPAQRARLVACELATGIVCIKSSLEAFLPRAWRRPAAPAEVDRLMALAATEAAAGGSAEEQLKLALRGVLTSAHFMYLVELDPDPASPTPHPLNSYELASRLSYFLWSSMPDDELLSVAAQGTLQDGTVLGNQVTRMLTDAKAAAMSEVFAAQWLQLPTLLTHQPKADVFPEVTDALKQSMAQETTLFFKDLLATNASVQSLVAGNHTFVNATLAQHYDFRVTPTEFSKVSVDGTTRLPGVLGHGGVLMLTSGLTKTSAVKRGAWVLENLLCTPPPAPPPDVMKELVEKKQEIEAAAEHVTQRAFLAQHRAQPKCAVCHNLIDPVGLGFENYDAIGRYRTMDQGMSIDATGSLVDGTAFQTPQQLLEILAKDPALGQCVAKKLFTFALGRTPGVEDAEHLAALSANNDDPLSTVLGRLVTSLPFRNRRAGAL